MDNGSSNEGKEQQPAPEALVQRSDTVTDEQPSATPTQAKRLGRAYRPSYRATFIGLAAVAVILAINGIVIALVIHAQTKTQANALQGQVTVSQDVLNKLGVNQGTVGDQGIQLTIGPNTEFKGQVTIGGDISIAGKLHLNSTLIATDAALTNLTAGTVTNNQLTVSDQETASNVNVEKQLNVLGITQLQGAVTVTQLFTVNNNANIAGSLSVGNSVSAASITARSLTTTSTLTISGHIITAGLAPVLVPGSSALGSNGTASISGNDAAGTVAINIGTGATGGLLASVTFHTSYSVTPHVVVTPVGDVGIFYISRNNAGFSVYVRNSISPGGYAFDYIVMQ